MEDNKKKNIKKPKKTLSKDSQVKVDKKQVKGTKGRLLKGIITSDKMDKTVVVLVNRYKEHPKYKKRYKVSKKYKADDPKNEYKVGDKIIIQETRPISKDKKWKVVKKI